MAGPNGDDQPPSSKPPEDDKDSESDDGDAAEEVSSIKHLDSFQFIRVSRIGTRFNCFYILDLGRISLSSMVEEKRTSETKRCSWNRYGLFGNG